MLLPHFRRERRRIEALSGMMWEAVKKDCEAYLANVAYNALNISSAKVGG
jgi:hypothetical protein